MRSGIDRSRLLRQTYTTKRVDVLVDFVYLLIRVGKQRELVKGVFTSMEKADEGFTLARDCELDDYHSFEIRKVPVDEYDYLPDTTVKFKGTMED